MFCMFFFRENITQTKEHRPTTNALHAYVDMFREMQRFITIHQILTSKKIGYKPLLLPDLLHISTLSATSVPKQISTAGHVFASPTSAIWKEMRVMFQVKLQKKKAEIHPKWFWMRTFAKNLRNLPRFMITHRHWRLGDRTRVLSANLGTKQSLSMLQQQTQQQMEVTWNTKQ